MSPFIPTNRQLIASKLPTLFYRTEKEKFEAVVNGILQEEQLAFERHSPIPRARPAGACGHNFHREIRGHRGIAEKGWSPAPGASTHSSTNANRASLPKPAQRRSSPWPPTWPAAGTDILLGGNPEQMTRDHFLKTNWPCRTRRLRRDRPLILADGNGAQPTIPWCFFQNEGKNLSSAGGPVEAPVFEQFAGAMQIRTRRRSSRLADCTFLAQNATKARRIDNQLRGRAGRQGDPGSSRFFLSLEDDLMRIFGGERIRALMFRLGHDPKGVPIESRMISSRIEKAQQSVEAQKFRCPQTFARVRRCD